MTDENVEPGWYPDPRHRDQFRYWDGKAWTEHAQAAYSQSAAVTEPPPAPAPAASRPRGRVGLVALLCVLLAGSFVGAFVLLGGSDSDKLPVLIGTDVGSADFDLYAVKLGDEIDSDQRVLTDRSTVYPVDIRQDGTSVGGMAEGRILVVTTEDGDNEQELVAVDLQSGETERAFDTNDGVDAFYERSTGQLFVRDGVWGGDQSCLVASGFNKPAEIAESGSCSFLANGLVVARDFDADNEYSVYDIAGNLVWRDDDISRAQINKDGTRLAVVRQTSSSVRVELLELPSGRSVLQGDRVDSAQILSVVGDGVVVSVEEDGDTTYGLLSTSGFVEYLKTNTLEGEFAWARVSSGQKLTSITTSYTDRPDQEVTFFDTATGRVLSAVQGESIELFGSGLYQSGDGFVVVVGDGTDTDVYAIDPATGATTLVFSMDDRLQFVENVAYDDSFETVYLVGFVEGRNDELEGVVVALDLPARSGFVFQDGSQGASVLRLGPDGSAAIAASDSGDVTLTWLDASKGFAATELDEVDDGWISQLWIMPNGDLLYNANDDGDEEVRRVNVDGRDRAEVLYEDARILAVGWEQPAQVNSYLYGD